VSRAQRSPDHYATLGVPRNADAARIRDAYRTLVRRHHPDLHPNDPDAEEALKRINEAYDVLSDPEKRRKYNLLGVEWEDILRDEAELRRTAGAAPVGRGASSPPPRTEAAWSPRAAIPPSVPLVLLALVVVGIGMLASQARRATPMVVTNAVRRFERATPSLRGLHATLAEFRGVLEADPAPWSTACGSPARTTGVGHEQRYARAARDVVTGIDRAEEDGLFALPLAEQDRRVLGALLPLRAELEQDGVLDCSDPHRDESLRELVRRVAPAERCLEQLVLAGAGAVRAEARRGKGTCW
jgi:curved DNA-binding protein CbpA